MNDLRIQLLDWLLRQEGKPYVWGAKGDFNPDPNKGGELVQCYDCSGLVSVGLKLHGVKDCPDGSFNQFAKFESTLDPMPLDLAFYGPPKRINHVMWVWGDGRVYGACGGNSSVMTVSAARRINACVKWKSKAKYRPDFRGFRKIPLH